ncbi:MAG: VWA domain-containing protein [Ignavibacteriae bacterium]|nr:VWA domain-containing protein [Ignavibacteriota bacterium]
MKSLTLIIVLLLVATFGAAAMSFPERNPRITIDGTLNCPYISTDGGTVYLQISIKTSEMLRPDRARRPMNIAVVLDRSGSMADERKMDYAKSALSKLIDQLGSEDLFSLVVYDDVVDVLRSASRVGNKRDVKRLISDIYPRNSTNLGGGMMEGLQQAERNLGKAYVNRVILISDGLANQGITNPAELNSIARRYRNKSISLTTMGVGLDYNENLMIGLSESGGGNYYFIESPSQLAQIMNKELNSASAIVAQNATLDLTLGRGVRVLDVIGCERPSNSYSIPVGDLYANETREFTVELSVPPGRGDFKVVSGVLRCDCGALAGMPSFSTTIHYTHVTAEIERNRNLDVQAKSDIALSTRRVENAMKALDEGRNEEAKRELDAAKQALVSSPAAAASGATANSIHEQASRIDSYNKVVGDKDADLNRAKKAIQYENYQVQKKK